MLGHSDHTSIKHYFDLWELGRVSVHDNFEADWYTGKLSEVSENDRLNRQIDREEIGGVT